MPRGDPGIQISVRVQQQQNEALKERASRARISVVELVRRYIASGLEQAPGAATGEKRLYGKEVIVEALGMGPNGVKTIEARERRHDINPSMSLKAKGPTTRGVAESTVKGYTAQAVSICFMLPIEKAEGKLEAACEVIAERAKTDKTWARAAWRQSVLDGTVGNEVGK